jgi:hypothetical protein
MGVRTDETMIRFGEELMEVIAEARKYKSENNLSL